jgi:hypothetical protein
VLDVCLYTSCVVFLKLPYGSLDACFKTFYQIEESLKNAELFSKGWIFDWWRPVFAYMFHFLLLKHHQNPIGLHRCQSSSKAYFLLFVWIYINETRLIFSKRNPYFRDILQDHNTLLFLLLFFFVVPLACFFKNKRCLLTWYKLFSLKKVVQGFLSILLVLVLFEFEKVFRKIKVEIS